MSRHFYSTELEFASFLSEGFTRAILLKGQEKTQQISPLCISFYDFLISFECHIEAAEQQRALNFESLVSN